MISFDVELICVLSYVRLEGYYDAHLWYHLSFISPYGHMDFSAALKYKTDSWSPLRFFLFTCMPSRPTPASNTV